MFQCLPAGFEKNPLLGIEQLSFARVVTKECGIEIVGAFVHSGRIHKSRMIRFRGVDISLAQFFFGKRGEAFFSLGKILPKFLWAAATGETA